MKFFHLAGRWPYLRSLATLVFLLPAAALLSGQVCAAATSSAQKASPVKLIFDTDMGNDIDDALALGVIHALESRGECKLLAVTVSKDYEFSAPYIDLVNTFYGRGDIPIGVVRDGKTPEPSRYVREPVEAREGDAKRHPHDLVSGRDAPDALAVLRRTLAAAADGEVVLVVVGFSTNIARLLDTPADEYSPLTGRELVQRKCRLLSMMAGMFSAEGRHKEYNVYEDLAAARKVFAEWPTPIVASGFEIGREIKFPAASIERDFAYVPHHPLAEAYRLYLKMPYDRETWDLTSVLYAVRPDHGYFGLSEPGSISVDESQVTQFAATSGGHHRYLTADEGQRARVLEVLVLLASQPPHRPK